MYYAVVGGGYNNGTAAYTTTNYDTTAWANWINTTMTTSVTGTWVYIVQEVERKQYSKSERKKMHQAEVKRREDAAEAERKRKEALSRAETLLLEHLTEEQITNWKRAKCFRCKGKSGRVYEVSEHHVAQVTKKDRVLLCNHVLHQGPGMLPAPDIALARKLAIELNEEYFLTVANGIQPV